MEWIKKSPYEFYGLRAKRRDGVNVLYKNDNSFYEFIETDLVRNILRTEKDTLIRSERDLKVKD